MTTAERLQSILDTKAAIKQAITDKGVEGVGDTFSTYPAKIAEIPSGGPASRWVLTDQDKLAYSTWTSVPEKFDFSQCTNGDHLFYECTNMVTPPSIDTTNWKVFKSMYAYCRSLKTLPQMNLDSATDVSYLFQYCAITEAPYFNGAPLTTVTGLFAYCKQIKVVHPLNTSNCSQFASTFASCTALETIEGTLDLSKAGSSISSMFNSCSALKEVRFSGRIDYNFSMSSSTKLSYDSVFSLLTACSNTSRSTTAKTLTLKVTLSVPSGDPIEALIADCKAKKWTISGLTVNYI